MSPKRLALSRTLAGRARSQARVGTVDIKNRGVAWRYEYRGMVYQWRGELDADGAVRASVGDSDVYKASGRGARPSPFRFKEGGADLDTGRLAISRASRVSLSRRRWRASRFYLVGFADVNGDWRANLSLTKHRAQRVADALTHEPGPCQTGKRSHLSRGTFWLLSMNGGFP